MSASKEYLFNKLGVQVDRNVEHILVLEVDRQFWLPIFGMLMPCPLVPCGVWLMYDCIGQEKWGSEFATAIMTFLIGVFGCWILIGALGRYPRSRQMKVDSKGNILSLCWYGKKCKFDLRKVTTFEICVTHYKMCWRAHFHIAVDQEAVKLPIHPMGGWPILKREMLSGVGDLALLLTQLLGVNVQVRDESRRDEGKRDWNANGSGPEF